MYSFQQKYPYFHIHFIFNIFYLLIFPVYFIDTTFILFFYFKYSINSCQYCPIRYIIILIFLRRKAGQPSMSNIIITGASRGIGRAIALALADKNNNIMLNCVQNKDLLTQVQQDIIKIGGNAEICIGDVGCYNTAQNLVTCMQHFYGDVDILINNAGISAIGLLQDTTPLEWRHIFHVNVDAIYNCCRLCIPDMIKKKSGRIINISSVWGTVGASCEVAYSASKGAVNAMTKALAKELAPSNIQVNAIACGAIDTEMNHHLNDDEKKSLADEIPVGRMGKPEEIGEFVKQLCSSPSYLTGQIITIDGCWT